MAKRKCRKCGRRISYANQTGICAWCMPDGDYQKAWRERNKKKIEEYNSRADVQLRRRLYYIEKNHGVSREWYLAQLEKQGNKCACCGRDFSKLKSKEIHVDHDHRTGKVRGIICMKCNFALGDVNDSIERIQKVIDYLKKHGK